jgi:hypothetical protein
METNHMAMETEVMTKSRAAVSKRTFKKESGEYTSRVSTESIGFKIELIESGHIVEYALRDFSDEVIKAAALFGIVTSVTNAFGAIKDPDEMAEAMDNRLEALINGEWTSERETGPRTSDILEAYIAFRAKHGKDTTQANQDKFLANLKDGSTTLKDLLASEAGLAAEYAAIKAKRIIERADKAAAKAGTQDAKDSSLLD